MRLINRIEKLERGAGMGLCPCREARKIEIVRECEDEGEARQASVCELCGSPLPVTRIVLIRRPAREESRRGGVRFVVKVPPKMSREEWRRYVREREGPGAPPRFTIDLDGAGGEGESHGAQA